jgi:hypothetical protein
MALGLWPSAFDQAIKDRRPKTEDQRPFPDTNEDPGNDETGRE